jgi:exopolysaccharide biosynthesis WecB/TagA/CpsF family protein
MECLFPKLLLESNNLFSPNSSLLISFVNPYSYFLLRKQNHVIQKIDLWGVDGIALCYLLRIMSNKFIPRYSFDMTSLAPVLFENAVKEKKSVYFIGSKREEIALAVDKIKYAYPELNVVGFRDGYVKDNEQIICPAICELNPDIVIVGMGTPLQEDFILKLRDYGWNGLGITCGGFFHQTAKKVNYYPSWIDKYNLRWLYRIYDEPKLFKRYFFVYPLALFFIFFDMIGHKIGRLKENKADRVMERA